MSPYARTISEMTGSTEPATLALIEELMRSERTALDSLTHDEFRGAVAVAVIDMHDLHGAGMLPGYCEALSLAVPAALAA